MQEILLKIYKLEIISNVNKIERSTLIKLMSCGFVVAYNRKLKNDRYYKIYYELTPKGENLCGYLKNLK